MVGSKLLGVLQSFGTHAGTKMLVVVAVALLNDRGQVLLAKRTDIQTFAGMWEFPGGKVRPVSCTAPP